MLLKFARSRMFIDIKVIRVGRIAIKLKIIFKFYTHVLISLLCNQVLI